MPGGDKEGGGLEVVGSAYKMKYQGNHSAFPFKSPLKDEDTGDEKIEKEELEEETEEEIAIEQIKPF